LVREPARELRGRLRGAGGHGTARYGVDGREDLAGGGRWGSCRSVDEKISGVSAGPPCPSSRGLCLPPLIGQRLAGACLRAWSLDALRGVWSGEMLAALNLSPVDELHASSLSSSYPVVLWAAASTLVPPSAAPLEACPRGENACSAEAPLGRSEHGGHPLSQAK